MSGTSMLESCVVRCYPVLWELKRCLRFCDRWALRSCSRTLRSRFEDLLDSRRDLLCRVQRFVGEPGWLMGMMKEFGVMVVGEFAFSYFVGDECGGMDMYVPFRYGVFMDVVAYLHEEGYSSEFCSFSGIAGGGERVCLRRGLDGVLVNVQVVKSEGEDLAGRVVGTSNDSKYGCCLDWSRCYCSGPWLLGGSDLGGGRWKSDCDAIRFVYMQEWN